MKEYLVYGGVNSLDYRIYIANVNQFDAPKKSVETIKIPGRNGTLSISDGSYENIDIVYNLYSTGDVRSNINAFKGAINALDGIYKLSDTYSPDHYRYARYIDAFTVETSDRKNAGFSVKFDCDPRKFLKSGDVKLEFTGGGQVKNPTLFEALPLIRAYGTGSFTIGDVSVAISSASTYTDIDCETQEAYKGATNCNGNITLTNGVFPSFKQGINSISKTGISKLEITPRWWTI